MAMATLHLDMDGVVVDWVTGCAEIIGRRIDDPHIYCTPEEWALMRTQKRFFRDLPKLPKADRLVEIARQYRDELNYELVFLTAVPHYNDIHYAYYDKVLWAQKHYPDIPVHFGPFSHDKHKHCVESTDILVDDRTDNCNDWRKAGGIAINMPYQSARYGEALATLKLLFEGLKNLG